MKIKTWINWFIPERIQKDPESYRKSFLIICFSLGAFFIVSFLTATTSSSINPPEVFGIVAFFLVPLILRYAKSTSIAGNFFIGSLFLYFVLAMYTRTPSQISLRWTVNVVPITGFLLLRLKYSSIWSLNVGILVAVILISQNYFHYWDQLTPDEQRKLFTFDTEDIIDLYMNFVTIAAIGILMERGKNLAFASLDEALAKSESMSSHLTEVFKQVKTGSAQIGQSSEDLITKGNVIEQNAQATTTQAGKASSASENIAGKNKILSSTLDLLSQSTLKIDERTNHGLEVTRSAVSKAEETENTMEELGQGSQDIAKVSDVIYSIARQTNLLSLNAAIEAAKAGEAGRGFAVVSGSVKELAIRTTKATADISQKVEFIRIGTSQAIDAITEISMTIQNINDFQQDIARTVEVGSRQSSSRQRNQSLKPPVS